MSGPGQRPGTLWILSLTPRTVPKKQDSGGKSPQQDTGDETRGLLGQCFSVSACAFPGPQGGWATAPAEAAPR